MNHVDHARILFKKGLYMYIFVRGNAFSMDILWTVSNLKGRFRKGSGVYNGLTVHGITCMYHTRMKFSYSLGHVFYEVIMKALWTSTEPNEN